MIRFSNCRHKTATTYLINNPTAWENEEGLNVVFDPANLEGYMLATKKSNYNVSQLQLLSLIHCYNYYHKKIVTV